MAFKRRKAYRNKFNKRKSFRRRPASRRPRRKFASKVMNVVNRKAEVKEVMLNVCTNTPVLHNDVLNLMDNAFYSNVGVIGEQIGIGSNGARTGKKLYAKGINVALHIENQQYRPEVKYTLYLVRNKRNIDLKLTAKGQIWEGVNTTIPLDYIDTSKVDIMFQKNITVRQSNVGTTNTAGGAGVFDTSKVVVGADPLPFVYEGIDSVVTNARYMGKFYIPINKTILYRDYFEGDNAQTVPVASRFQWVLTGYDNRSTTTGDTTWPLGHVNMTTKFKFTDV